MGGGYLRTPNYTDSELKFPDYKMDFMQIRSNSMFVSVIPTIMDEPKVVKTTHTLVKTKSIRVILQF